MPNIFSFAILFAAMVSMSACGAAAAQLRHAEIVNGETAQRLDAALTEAAKNGFGGAVLVGEKGAPILKAGYG